MDTLVILPTYEEHATIASVVRGVRATLPDATVLVVDDNSPDGTAKVVEEVAAEIGGVELLERPAKLGLGSAYRDGFRWGLERDFDVLVEMDSDCSHDPAVLPELLAPLRLGVELVIGSRYVAGGSIPRWTLPRRLLSRAGNVYSARLLGLPVADATSGYRAYAASLLRRLDLSSVRADGYGFQIEMVHLAARAGAEIAEVPIRFTDRAQGYSKMSTRVVSEAFWLVTLAGLRRLVRRDRVSLRRLPSRRVGTRSRAVERRRASQR